MAAWKLWGPGCECCTGCTGTICFTVKQCDASTSVAGATVTISLLGVDVATGTTDASGQCCIGITSAATYDYTVVKTGYETKTGTVAATCATNNVTLTYGASLCVTVTGCNSSPTNGATVTIKSGATTVGTATTNSSGVGCVQLLASTGTYTVEVSKSRYATDSVSRTITCGGTRSVSLSPDTGYACDLPFPTPCPDPLPTTLYLTTPRSTSITLAYNAFGGGTWDGSETLSIANAWDCSSGTFVTQNVEFRWSYGAGSIAYAYYVCLGYSSTTALSGVTDPVTGYTCSGGYGGLGYGGSPPVDIANRTATGTPSCGPLSFTSSAFPSPPTCSPTSAMQYYSGTATVTE